MWLRGIRGMKNDFRLYLLGPVVLKHRETAVHHGFESRKAVALLGYMAVQDQPISRTLLADMFWGNKPESRGRSNLSRVIHNLTHLLPGCLQGDRNTVQFQYPGDLWLDVRAFSDMAATDQMDKLTAAVALYRDDFMTGLYLNDCPEFETWLVVERELWRQQVIHLLQILIARHTQTGDYEQGLEFTTRLLALDAWREEAHRQMMRLLAYTDQWSAALAQYKTCRRVLTNELGVEPSTETTTLYEQIRDGQLPVKPPPAVHDLSQPTAPPTHNLPAPYHRLYRSHRRICRAPRATGQPRGSLAHPDGTGWNRQNPAGSASGSQRSRRL